MITFKQKVYTAVGDSENSSYVIGYFLRERDATQASVGKGWYGGDARIRPEVLNIQIFESYKEFEDSLVENKKQAALSKLTEEEKKLLGLL